MFTWKEPNYHIITTLEQLRSLRTLLQKTIDNNKPIVVDLETTGAVSSSGLDEHHGWLLGVVFSVDQNDGYYIPLNHTKEGQRVKEQLTLNQFRDEFGPLMESGGVWIGHNIKFDYKFLWRAGIHLFPNLWDTMIAAKLLNGDARMRVGLKEIIGKHIDIPHRIIQTFTEAAHGNASEVDPIDFSTYAINDTIFTYYLYMVFKPKIDEQYKKLFYKAEAPLIPVLAQMELRGIRIDTEYYKNIRYPLEKCRDKIALAFRNRYSINIASPLQLGQYMLKTFPRAYLDKTAKNNIKTDVEALQTVMRRHKNTDPVYKFVKHVLFYRGINKALNTYIDKYPTSCHQYYTDEGVEYILHTRFNQIMNSGRLSSSPNIQNITRDTAAISVRRGFVARKGKKLVEADWKGMELRIVAIDSGETKMVEAFKQNPLDADLHTLTAKGIFAKKQVTNEERHIAKTINFSILYGATEFSISKTLNCSKEKAREYLGLFYQTYPGIKKWKVDTERKIREHGYTETFFGRKRFMPLDLYPSMSQRYRYDAGVRQLVNHIIQGTSADLLKFSMVRIEDEFAKQGLDDTYLLSTTHDSIVAETYEPEEVSGIMNDIMEVEIKGILLPVDIAIKDSFAKR